MNLKNNKSALSFGVVVPSYERPEMVHFLIKTFLNQSYGNKNIYIYDDSKTDKVKEVVESFNFSNIFYIKNEVNLGYCENLKKCLLTPKDDIVFVMGDDDCFANPNALSRYADVFDKHADVGYVYSNQAQIDEKNKVDYVLKSRSVLFEKGKSAVDNICMTSVFIPGMAFRQSFIKPEYYPNKTLLFPQLYFTARILLNHDGYLIGEPLIAGRAHSGQLGFAAIEDRNIKGDEKHGTLEIIELIHGACVDEGVVLDLKDCEYNLLQRYSTGMLKETLIVGKARVAQNYFNYIKNSTIARNSYKLKFNYFLSQKLNYKTVSLIRDVYIYVKKFRHNDDYAMISEYLNEIK